MKNYRPKSEKTASFAWKSAELNRETAPIKLIGKEPVIGKSCVGCGACTEVCPASIIKIAPAVT